MKYSIIIPTYNHCDDLLKPCIDSIFKYTDMTEVELIISANGCKDNTVFYVTELTNKFKEIGFEDHLKIVWSDAPLGYSRANNEALKIATGERIVLLNNDTVLLPQTKHQWLSMLNHQFELDDKCGISCVSKGFSDPAGHDFAIFFCVMIDKKVIDQIGVLNEEYGTGSSEDIEFCIEAQRAGFTIKTAAEQVWNGYTYSGIFPIYHKGEGTVHDAELIQNWDDTYSQNLLKLAKKYNPAWYNKKISGFKKYNIVIPTYNHCDDLLKPCIESLLKYTDLTEVKILVVANGCTDNTKEYINSLNNANIELIWSDEPIGFVNATNLGLSKTNSDYVILLNNDTYLLDTVESINWIARLEEPFIKDPSVGITGPSHAEHLSLSYRTGIVCDAIVFYCAMIKRKVLDQLGGLDVNYSPGGVDDHDFCLRAKNAGFNLCGVGFSSFPLIHKENQTFGEHSDKYICILHRNEEYFINKFKKYETVAASLAWIAEDDPEHFYQDVIVNNEYSISAEQVQNRTVIDIGANIGTFSILCSSLGAKQVLSVEPMTATHSRFVRNVNRAKLSNIKIFKNLVTDKEGDLVQISNNVQTGSNSMYNVTDNFESLSTITLDTLLNEVEGDDIFLKLDCEGAEFDIILNASAASMKRISKIVMEVHTNLHPKYNDISYIHDKLKSFGFTLVSHRPMFMWYDNGHCEPMPFVNDTWVRAI